MTTMRILLASLLCAAPAAAQSASDDFNRPNSTNLGPDWVEVMFQGEFEIENNQLKSANQFGFGWMHHATMTGNYADSTCSMDFVVNGFGGDSFSLVAGLDPNTWGGVEVKLQDNDGDGLVDRLFFNAAINAGNWNGSPLNHDLLTPLAAGRMTLSFTNNGDTAVVDIEDLNGNVETFTGSGINSFQFPITGTNFGIASFGDSWMDNWSASVGPQGPSISLLGSCGTVGSGVAGTGMTPNGLMGLAWSQSQGQFVIGGAACVGTTVDLVNPRPIAVVSADASGNALVAPGAGIPAAGCGVVFVQALDIGTCTASNVLAL